MRQYLRSPNPEKESENGDETLPAYGHVHIIRSLKRPHEIFRLRQIYRPGLYIIGVFATEEERIEYLTRRKGYSRPKSELLMELDEAQADDEYGQHNRKTFHLADVFVDTQDGHYKDQLERFLDLVFGNPLSLQQEVNMACFWLRLPQCA